MRIVRAVFRFLGSFHLSVAIFGLLTLITWAGTLSQETIGLFQSQKVYFESWFVTRTAGDVTLPVLPGGLLLMTALFVNLVVGGLVQFVPRVVARARGRSRAMRVLSGAGIAITHVGIVALLLSCLLKYQLAEEGGLQLYEGQSASTFVSYHDWEISIEEVVGDGVARELVVPPEAFQDRAGDRTATVRGAELPFRLRLSGFAPNAEVRRTSTFAQRALRVVDGYALQPVAPQKEWERNVAGCYAEVEDASGAVLTAGILWGLARHPLTVVVGDRTFALSLRKQRMPMPFRIQLDRFVHEYHPNTRIPRRFMSDVTIVGADGTGEHRIRMNEPLRKDGTIVFQSSWGPDDAQPGTPLYSGFSVVRNPADQGPWYALYVIAFGMLLHFVVQAARFLLDQATESRRRAA